MKNRFVQSALATCAAAAVMLLGTASVASASAPHASTRSVSPAVVLPKGARTLGPLLATKTLHFVVYLNSKNQKALGTYAADVSNKNNLDFGHYLARGEFASRFGASSASLSAARTALRDDGLHVKSSVVDGLGLRVSGTVATIDRAFDTSIVRVHLSSGRVGTATSSAIRMPSALASSILAIIGLDNLVAPSAHIVPLSHLKKPTIRGRGHSFSSTPSGIAGAPNSCGSATSDAQYGGFGGITDDQVATAYGANGLYSAGDLASDQTIAIYELEPFSMSDVAQFDQCYFGHSNTSNISVLNVDGGPGSGVGSGESALDIDDVSALAPSAHIDVYQASPTESGSIDAYGQIVSNDTAQVVTTSWGACEYLLENEAPGALDVEHVLFEQAAAQGQTVFAAAGDSGNDDCSEKGGYPVSPLRSVDDPGSQPYVVSVGGTTAVTVTHPPQEQVWNDGAEGGAGGGGNSALWSEPSWQAADPSVVSASTSSKCGPAATSVCRTVPDVSAFADEYTGITIVIGGQWYVYGGTSSAAPIWAAMLAEVNDSNTCTASSITANGVGFVSPLLYEIAQNPTKYAESFNDVTSGNNDIFSNSGGQFAAGTGYDLASGLGSPNLSGPSGIGLAANLCGAAQETSTSGLTSISPSSGTAAGGTTVTITGTGFETGSTSNVKGVAFGEIPAKSFQVTSATTILAVTGPDAQPKAIAQFVPAGTESLVSVVFTSGHVATGSTFSYLVDSSGAELPTVLTVGPSGGPAAGGNTVYIYGTGFTGATAVDFGRIPATSFVVKSDSLITAVAPPDGYSTCLKVSHTATSGLCQSQVVVKGPEGSSTIVPALKPFTGFLEYTFSGVPYLPSKCKCELFPTLTEYDFQAPAVVTSITNLTVSKKYPLASPYGGDLVKVTGTGFNWLTLDDVTFGDPSQAANQDYSYNNVTSTGFFIETEPDPSPSPSGDSQPVSVVSEGGASASIMFAYGPVPKITSISATTISSSGNQLLTLHGSGFSHIFDVEFVSAFNLPSTEVLRNFTVQSSTQMTVLTPSLVPGSYFVAVDNDYGDSSLYSEPLSGPALSYETVPVGATNINVVYPNGPQIMSSSGGTCSVLGGCTMTLTGKGLTNTNGLAPGTVAYVGEIAATIQSFSIVYGYDVITITVPPAFLEETGLYPVIVVTPNGVTPETLSALVNYTD